MTLRNSPSQMRRANYEFAGNARYSKPALNDLDRKLGRYLMRRRGIFVEAGANHAFTQSNPYYLQRFLGWSGLLGLMVEAIPALYQRATTQTPRVFNCALVPFQNEGEEVEFTYHVRRPRHDGQSRNVAEHIREVQTTVKIVLTLDGAAPSAATIDFR
jgi:hypothetical protein